MKLKFKVRRNPNRSKASSYEHGDWFILDPNGLVHMEGFYSKEEALKECKLINEKLTEALS